MSSPVSDESTLIERPDASDEPTLRADRVEAATVRWPESRVGAPDASTDDTFLDAELPTIIFDERVPDRHTAGRSITIVTAATANARATIAASHALAPSDSATVVQDSADDWVPDEGVRYVVVGEAGRGGMGMVHVARDVDLLRRVALKELAPNVADDRGARARFVREVQVTAQLDHPHIVPVYSLEVAAGGRPAYAMKLVEGRTFTQLIAETRAAHEAGRAPDADHSVAARLEQFLKVCDALEYAHARGVVHRDLKPANLMLGRHNEVYVMDWGICRLVGGHDSETSVGTASSAAAPDAAGETAFGAIVGTPLYMSPEQAQGRHADLEPRSDLCALGLILFELVTLARPFTGRTVIDILQQAAAGERAPVTHAFGDAIPIELVAIIERATAADPVRRYASVAAFADDLRHYLRGEAVAARPDTRWQKAVRAVARHRQTAAVIVLGFALLSVMTVAGLLWRHDRALDAQQTRERRIQAWAKRVAEQGDLLQTRLLEVRGEFEALAAGLAQASQFGQPSPAPLEWMDENRAGALANGGHLSGAFRVLPGASRRGVEPLARRLVNLRRSEEEILDVVQHVLGRAPNTAVAARGEHAEDTGLHELAAAFDAGLLYVFPSANHLTRGEDPRRLPWYTATAAPGVHWTLMQADNDASHELTLSTAVHDADGQRVGAAGLVLSLEHVLANLVRDHPIPGVSATILIVRDGVPLAVHSTSGNQQHVDDLVRRLPLADIARGLTADDTGVIEIDRLGGADVVAFDRIHPLEWTLVAVIHGDDLFRQ